MTVSEGLDSLSLSASTEVPSETNRKGRNIDLDKKNVDQRPSLVNSLLRGMNQQIKEVGKLLQASCCSLSSFPALLGQALALVLVTEVETGSNLCSDRAVLQGLPDFSGVLPLN